jgi:hypothetical protein
MVLKQVTLSNPDLTADERCEQWVRIVNRIREEHIGLGWTHYVFRLLREIFNSNERLRETGGYVLSFVAEMYVTHTLMVLRRDMDRQGGTENLLNLLYDMKRHARIINRSRVVRMWSPDDASYAEADFERWSPVSSESGRDYDHINPEAVQSDIDSLDRRVARVREYAERTRAHRTPALDSEVSVTYDEMHTAIRQIRNVINRYYTLLTASTMGQWEPVPQFSVLTPFLSPWLDDDFDVQRRLIEAVERDSIDPVSGQ